MLSIQLNAIIIVLRYTEKIYGSESCYIFENHSIGINSACDHLTNYYD